MTKKEMDNSVYSASDTQYPMANDKTLDGIQIRTKYKMDTNKFLYNEINPL